MKAILKDVVGVLAFAALFYVFYHLLL